MKKMICTVALLVAMVSSASALTLTIAPTTGVAGTAVTNSFADAITQINASADTTHTVNVRSTEGAIVLPDNTTWTITSTAAITIQPESGSPVVVLSWASGQYMLTIAGTATTDLTVDGITFIPEAGLAYTNNVGDGINAGLMRNYVFKNCIFSSNNGSNAAASAEGALAFVQPPAGNNVGDDWIFFTNAGIVSATLENCTVTGANDDAILVSGTGTSMRTLNLTKGTVIANNGGAGLQIANVFWTVNADGSAGRVLIADNGKRTGAADSGIKSFWDDNTVVNINKTDIVGNTLGGFDDFSGTSVVTITDSRIALNNTSATATQGNLSFDDVDSTVGDSGANAQTITITRATIHDSGSADGIIAPELATKPRQVYTIVDSIFSGAGDGFANMSNSIASGGASPAPTISTSAVVTAGAHAVAAAGELAAASINGDPSYASLTYTIARGAANADFLRPTAAAYLTSSAGGGILGGIGGSAPVATGANDTWTMYN